MEKNNDKRWIFILILIIGIIIIAVYDRVTTLKEIENKEKNIQERNKNDRKMEIQAYAYEMLSYAAKKKTNNLDINCVPFFPFDNNYIGSVDVSSEEYYIWISDGTFYVTGTSDNLAIIESDEEATVTCNAD